jgi:hypothetical protein
MRVNYQAVTVKKNIAPYIFVALYLFIWFHHITRMLLGFFLMKSSK